MGGKGRAPCCDKSQVKRGPWSPSEDLRLISFIQKHGHDNWRALPKQAGLVRCGKSCRLRWINYLRPDLKRGNFTKEEEDSIIKLHEAWGNKWSKIASQFPGRTDNEIKNVWNTHLRKRLVSKNSCGDDQSKELSSITSTSSTSSSSASFQLSSGNPSVEAAVEFEHQSGHESSMANKNPNEHELPNLTTIQEKIDQYSPMEVTNQVRAGDAKASKALTISSSFSSHDSSKGSSSSQGGISEPDNSLFDFAGAYETQIADKAEFEIPFESDGDFWNMLDGLVPFQPNHELLQEDDQANQSSNLGLVESGKWLSYLESELGLEQTTKTQINDQDFLMKDATEKLVPENYSDKLPQPAEIDQGMDDYFEMWPASFARQFCHLN